MNVKSVLKQLQGVIRFSVRLVSCCVPKKSGIIVFCSDRYNENSRYLFEYMVGQSIAEVYWLSYSEEITRYLKLHNYPVLDKWWIQIWTLMRSSVVVASGNIFWDRYGAVSSETKKYCLMHGCGPKVTEYHDDFSKTFKVLKQLNYFDFVNFPSPYTTILGANIYKLPRKKIVCHGYPRFDQLFLSDRNDYDKKRMELASVLGITLTEDTRLILYSPTFRKYDKQLSFPLSQLDGYSSKELDSLLKSNNIYIIYTKHPQTLGAGDWMCFDNCIYLDYEINKIFDISYFLNSFDALINDYSTISVDFSILNRPQIFVMPDYESYCVKDGFNEDYLDVIVGPVARDFSEFKFYLTSCIKLEESTKDIFYSKDPKKDLRKYWSNQFRESCKLNANFIFEISGLK